MRRFQQILIAIDQLFNAILSGWADETLSSRAWRQHEKKRRWYYLRRLIDGLFFWEKDHCRLSYESEQERSHLPPVMRGEK